jgi:hypothetical protein
VNQPRATKPLAEQPPNGDSWDRILDVAGPAVYADSVAVEKLTFPASPEPRKPIDIVYVLTIAVPGREPVRYLVPRRPEDEPLEDLFG